jgi:ethanolamine kinase
LLSANVIVLPHPRTNGASSSGNHSHHDDTEEVHFIDYEYATPSPAAFDIANHFAEWGGYDCDYNMMPTRSVRKEFLTEYVQSYYTHHGSGDGVGPEEKQKTVDKLYWDVDRFRGIPGFYW